MKRIAEAIVIVIVGGILTSILSLFADVRNAKAVQMSIGEKLEYIHKDVLYMRRRMDQLHQD